MMMFNKLVIKTAPIVKIGIFYFCGRNSRPLCGSFRRAVPFVEHLQNLKRYILKIQKKKIKWFFHIQLVFVTQGVNFKQYSINVFCLTNKITFKHRT